MSDALHPAPFVVGVGRSGTTLLRLMLDAHPELAIPPETHFLPALIDLYADGGSPSADELVGAVETHAGWRDFGMDEAELRAIFGASDGAARAIRAFFAAYAARHSKPRWGDKTPVYIESIALIGATLGDQARFVHLIRDGRDVAVSRGSRAVKRGREATPAAEEAKTWKRRIEGARTQAAEVEHYLELRYEDLIGDPEATLREVCEFIAIGFDPAMLNYHEGAEERLSELSDLPGKGGKVRPGSERIAAHALTSEPPRADRIERWRTELDAAAIADYEEVAGDLLAELGYPLDSALMRVGVSSYWFNRGQGVVGRQLRSALETLGHETFVLARPTRDTNIKPSFVDDAGPWAQEGVTVASSYEIPAEEMLAWARDNQLEVALFDQNYQFREIETLRESGVRTYGRFVWEHFGVEHVAPARRAFTSVYSVTECEHQRYGELDLETPMVPWGIHPELIRDPVPGDGQSVRLFFPGGFMSKRKPLEATLKAFRTAKGPELRLVVKAQVERGMSAVKDTALKDSRIEVIAADLPTEEHLRLFASADACLAPSRWEGLGLHLFEATAMGLPIITNNNPPMNEVVEDGRNGLLVPGKPSKQRPRSDIGSFEPDRRALTKAIERMRDPELRASLARGALERRDELSWERTTEALGQLLKVNE